MEKIRNIEKKILTLIHSYKNESDLNVKAQRRSKSGDIDLKQRNWLNAKNLALFMVLKTNTLSI